MFESGLLVFQMMSADNRRYPRFILKDGLVDPCVVTFVADHGIGPLSADQTAVRLDLQITVHQVPVGADGRIRALRQTNGSTWIHPSELRDRFLLIGTARSQVPVQLLVNIRRE